MEEKELFIRAQNGEREAREQLFGENAGLVHHVVKRFINRGGAEAVQEGLPVLLAHGLALEDALPALSPEVIHILPVDNPQESVGGAEDHVVAMAVFDDFLDVAGDALIFLLGAPGVLAGHIGCDEQPPPVRLEYGPGVDLIVLRLPAQQLLVVLDGQQGGGEQDRAAPPPHAASQVPARVHAQKLQEEAAVIA